MVITGIEGSFLEELVIKTDKGDITLHDIDKISFTNINGIETENENAVTSLINQLTEELNNHEPITSEDFEFDEEFESDDYFDNQDEDEDEELTLSEELAQMINDEAERISNRERPISLEQELANDLNRL